jgi:hypothetical protein
MMADRRFPAWSNLVIAHWEGMMRQFTGIAGVALLLFAGCSRSLEAKNQTAHITSLGYDFVFEYPEGTSIKLEGRRQDDGKGKNTEDITTTCGQQILRIVDGKLTLNGEDRGTVKPEDSIKLTSAGKLWVNQQSRGD